MSEDRSRFKIRNEEIEIEYEGSPKDVNERYDKAFEWISSVPREGKRKKGEKKEEEKKEEKKKGTRGPAIWSPAINTLIEEGYFKLPNRRTRAEVEKALEDKALPASGKKSQILIALTRKVRRGDLKGTKGPEGWVFWTE